MAKMQTYMMPDSSTAVQPRNKLHEREIERGQLTCLKGMEGEGGEGRGVDRQVVHFVEGAVPSTISGGWRMQ